MDNPYGPVDREQKISVYGTHWGLFRRHWSEHNALYILIDMDHQWYGHIGNMESTQLCASTTAIKSQKGKVISFYTNNSYR